MNRVKWTIHPVTDSAEDGDGPLYVVIPDDGTRGLLIGELADVEALAAALHRLLDNDEHDGEISRLHEQIGYNWLTAGQAEAKYSVPRASITWACRGGRIAEARKRGHLWEFPEVAFRHWMKNRPRS